jgi:hypothetical protein
MFLYENERAARPWNVRAANGNDTLLRSGGAGVDGAGDEAGTCES